MKRQLCQAKSEAKTWDELIEFTDAKIREMKKALENFRRMRDAGDVMTAALRTQSADQSQEPCHRV
jgi:hypothetical protein